MSLASSDTQFVHPETTAQDEILEPPAETRTQKSTADHSRNKSRNINDLAINGRNSERRRKADHS